MKITYKDEIKSDENATSKDVFYRILRMRNIENLDDFRNPQSPFEITLKDFGYDKEFKKIITLLKDIKARNGKVVVYTDYDADGITGGAILWETLHLLGFDVMPYVPDRRKEGYGFSKIGIDNVKKDFDPELIMSVDHGITAVNEIAYAKQLGINVIVTDHHHKQKEIPNEAKAIFHIPLLSGSGVAYFVAKEIYFHFKESCSEKSQKELQHNFEKDYLSLAAIGTIADLVPLVGVSRAVAKYGLKAFSDVKRYGVQAILKEATIENKIITPYEVGYIIAPRINAVGRLEHAIDALRLLCTTDPKRAKQLASQVGEKNIQRQDLVKQCVEEAQQMLEKFEMIPKVIVLHSPNWNEGVIGLIASNILEKYYRPVIIMRQSDGELKGSARSISSFHITHFFEEMGELFESFGGHAQAAGFTLPADNLELFKQRIRSLSEKKIKDEDLIKTIEVDLKVPINLHSLSLAKNLDKMAPFGIGNPKPSFVSEVELVSSSVFGKNKDHLKISVKDPNKSSSPMEFIAFGKADLLTSLSRGKTINIAYKLDINTWGGSESLRGMVIHMETC